MPSINKTFAPLLFALASAVWVAAQCPASQSYHVCCQSLEPFSANEYVWTNVCGITVTDTSVPVGSSCEEISSCPSGLYNLCCESLDSCPSDPDGPVAINCTVAAT